MKLSTFATFETCLALGFEIYQEKAIVGLRGRGVLPEPLKAAIAEHSVRLKEALDPLPLVELWHPTHQDQFAEAVASMLQDDLLKEQDAHALAYLLVIERQETPPPAERLAGLSRREVLRLLEPITAKDPTWAMKERSKPGGGLGHLVPQWPGFEAMPSAKASLWGGCTGLGAIMPNPTLKDRCAARWGAS